MESSSTGRVTVDGERPPLVDDVFAFFFACVLGLEERFLLGMGGNGLSFCRSLSSGFHPDFPAHSELPFPDPFQIELNTLIQSDGGKGRESQHFLHFPLAKWRG